MAEHEHAGREPHVVLDEPRGHPRVFGGVAAPDLARHEQAVDGQEDEQPRRREEGGAGGERLHEEVRAEQGRLPEVAALGLAEEHGRVGRGARGQERGQPGEDGRHRHAARGRGRRARPGARP